MVEFRTIEESDVEACVHVFKNTFSKEPWFDEDSIEEIENLFINHMNNNYFVGYVLVEENTILGISLGFSKPWIKGMEYYIDQFVISYDYQGKGFGSIFLELIDSDIKCRGMNAIILNTERGFPAEKFYTKNGFTILEDLIVLGK
ncbi:MAG: GNAT family N-acetyltransferase [Erysipelothrix sp.]